MKKFVIALIVTGALLASEVRAAAASVQPAAATPPNTQKDHGKKRKHSDKLASSFSTQSTGTSDSNNNAQEPDPKRQETGTAPPSSSSSSATSTVAVPSTASASASNTTNIIYDEKSFVAAVKSGDLTTVKLSFHAVKDDLEICAQALQDAARGKETAPGDHTGIAKFLLDQNINFDAAVIVQALKATLQYNRHVLAQYLLDKWPDMALKDVGNFFVDTASYRRSTITRLVLKSKYATRMPALFLRTASQITSFQIIKDNIAEHLKKRKAQEQAQTSTGADTKTSSSSSSASRTSSSSASSSSSTTSTVLAPSTASASASNTATITYDEKSFMSAVTNDDLATVKLSFDAVKGNLEICIKAFQDAALAGSTDIADFLDEKIKFDNATIARILNDAATDDHPVLVQYILDKKPDLDSEHVSNALTSSTSRSRHKVIDLLLNSKHAQKISAPSLEIAKNSALLGQIKNKIARYLEKREAKKLAQTSTKADTKVPSSTSSTSSTSSSSSSSSSSAATPSASNTASITCSKKSVAVAATTGNLSAFMEAAKNNRIKVVQDFLDKKDPEIDSNGVGLAFQRAVGNWRSRIINLFLESQYINRIPTGCLRTAINKAKSKPIKKKITKCLAEREAKELAQTNTLTAAINGNYDTIKLIIDTASHGLTQHTIGQALLFSIVHDHEKVSELLISHNATNATVKIAPAAYEDAFYAASIFERNKVVKLFLKYHVNGPIKIGSFCLLRARSIIRDETLKQFIFSQFRFRPQTGNVASAPPATNASPLALPGKRCS